MTHPDDTPFSSPGWCAPSEDLYRVFKPLTREEIDALADDDEEEPGNPHGEGCCQCCWQCCTNGPREDEE